MLDSAQRAVVRAADYLCAAQLPSGQWTDFWLPVGSSDAWVTAWAALAIAELRQQSARRAAAWLAVQQAAGGGWRYNATVAPDADSTAFVVSLFAKLAVPISADALAFLWAHYAPGRGFATYAFPDPAHAWTRPCADVTASVLLALYAARALDPPRLLQCFMELLHPVQQPSGDWEGFWWEEPAYTTALTLEVWHRAGRPALRFPLSLRGADDVFSTAGRLLVALHAQNAAAVLDLGDRLLSRQQPDGAWPGAARLRVPPSHPRQNGLPKAQLSRDRRRVFTTALALRALRAALPWREDSPAKTLPPRGLQRSAQGLAADRLFHAVATELGFADAAPVFRCLTESSLDERTRWPAPQLSSLSGGLPMEFSINISESPQPALRYTVEPGDVQAPPGPRARSAVAVAEKLVHLLDYTASWQRVLPAINLLLSSLESVAEWLRFVVWIGIDYPSTGSSPVLKVYFCLQPGVQIPTVLRAAGVVLAPAAATTLQLLSEHGFAQELGFGFAPGGQIGVKLYWELDGWRRPLIERILAGAAFPAFTDSLCPEIPGLLRESLAAKSRAGIALRLDVNTGEIAALTTATALIPGMLPASVIAARLQDWITACGWSTVPYQRLVTALASFGSPRHTLFTRTLSSSGKRTAAVYISPPVELFEPGA